MVSIGRSPEDLNRYAPDGATSGSGEKTPLTPSEIKEKYKLNLEGISNVAATRKDGKLVSLTLNCTTVPDVKGVVFNLLLAADAEAEDKKAHGWEWNTDLENLVVGLDSETDKSFDRKPVFLLRTELKIMIVKIRAKNNYLLTIQENSDGRPMRNQKALNWIKEQGLLPKPEIV